MKKTLPILTLLFIFLLAACSSPTEAPPSTMDESQVEDSVNATLTAMAPPPEQPTEVPTDEPTAPPPPTDTPVPTPTPTAIPIEGDPAALLGEPDGVDVFDSKGNWSLFDNDCFRSEIRDGRYWMESKGLEGIICWEVSWPLIENFYVETEVYMPETCQPNDRFGMLFRAPDNFRGYQYGLTCDGQFYMSSWDGEPQIALLFH